VVCDVLLLSEEFGVALSRPEGLAHPMPRAGKPGSRNNKQFSPEEAAQLNYVGLSGLPFLGNNGSGAAEDVLDLQP